VTNAPKILDHRAQTLKLADRKVTETANEAVSDGLEPIMCLVVLQTFNSRSDVL